MNVWIPEKALWWNGNSERSVDIIERRKRGRGASLLVEATPSLADELRHYEYLAWDDPGERAAIERAIKVVDAALRGEEPPKTDRAPRAFPTRKTPVTLRRAGVVIRNFTHYRSEDIAKIVQACKAENDEKRTIRVDVKYSRMRRETSSGYAWLGGTSMTVRIMRPSLDRADFVDVVEEEQAVAGSRVGATAADFARVVEHELRHCMGEHHSNERSGWRDRGGDVMPEAINDCTQAIPWAVGLGLRFQPPASKPKGVELAEKKRAHAAAMRDRHAAEIDKLEATIKRKKKLVREWEKKERYHERRIAAMKGEKKS